MQTSTDLSSLSDEELEQEVVTWAGRVSAGQARMLAAIGEVDARESWGGYGILSCAHWLGLKLNMAPVTAHEHVRVARKLRELPKVAAAMAEGRVSFTQVRAITRIASVENQDEWLNVAAYATGAQLDKMARGVARAKAADRGEKPKPHLSWAYDDDTGELVMTMRCPAEVSVPVVTAIEAAMEDAEILERAIRAAEAAEAASVAAANSSGSSAEESRPATAESSAEDQPYDGLRGPSVARRTTRMNALLLLAEFYLANRNRSGQVRDRARLRVYADPLTGWSRLADGELLPPAVTAQLVQGAPIPEIPSRATNLGRLQRDATAYQRQILEAIDGACCRFPGCTRRRRLHAHHIRWWSNGGGTDIDNLVLLCSRHHTLVHDGVYQLRLLPDRTMRVFSPKTGRLLSTRPERIPEADPASALCPDTAPDAARSKHEGDPLDLGFAVAVMCAL
jgi:hypothetical protein